VISTNDADVVSQREKTPTWAGPAVDLSVTDDVSVVRGNHQMTFGANASAWWVNSYTNTYYARFTFNGQNTGFGFADFFTGHAATFPAGGSAGQNKRQEYLAVYAADTWKFSPRLTFNYGLRWQPYLAMVHGDGSAIHFERGRVKEGYQSTRSDNTPAGNILHGRSGIS